MMLSLRAPNTFMTRQRIQAQLSALMRAKNKKEKRNLLQLLPICLLINVQRVVTMLFFCLLLNEKNHNAEKATEEKKLMSSKIKNMEKVSILFFHMLHPAAVVMAIFYVLPLGRKSEKVFLINLSGKSQH